MKSLLYPGPGRGSQGVWGKPGPMKAGRHGYRATYLVQTVALCLMYHADTFTHLARILNHAICVAEPDVFHRHLAPGLRIQFPDYPCSVASSMTVATMVMSEADPDQHLINGRPPPLPPPRPPGEPSGAQLRYLLFTRFYDAHATYLRPPVLSAPEAWCLVSVALTWICTLVVALPPLRRRFSPPWQLAWLNVSLLNDLFLPPLCWGLLRAPQPSFVRHYPPVVCESLVYTALFGLPPWMVYAITAYITGHLALLSLLLTKHGLTDQVPYSLPQLWVRHVVTAMAVVTFTHFRGRIWAAVLRQVTPGDLRQAGPQQAGAAVAAWEAPGGGSAAAAAATAAVGLPPGLRRRPQRQQPPLSPGLPLDAPFTGSDAPSPAVAGGLAYVESEGALASAAAQHGSAECGTDPRVSPAAVQEGRQPVSAKSAERMREVLGDGGDGHGAAGLGRSCGSAGPSAAVAVAGAAAAAAAVAATTKPGPAGTVVDVFFRVAGPGRKPSSPPSVQGEDVGGSLQELGGSGPGLPRRHPPQPPRQQAFGFGQDEEATRRRRPVRQPEPQRGQAQGQPQPQQGRAQGRQHQQQQHREGRAGPGAEAGLSSRERPPLVEEAATADAAARAEYGDIGGDGDGAAHGGRAVRLPDAAEASADGDRGPRSFRSESWPDERTGSDLQQQQHWHQPMPQRPSPRETTQPCHEPQIPQWHSPPGADRGAYRAHRSGGASAGEPTPPSPLTVAELRAMVAAARAAPYRPDPTIQLTRVYLRLPGLAQAELSGPSWREATLARLNRALLQECLMMDLAARDGNVATSVAIVAAAASSDSS